MNIQHRLVTSMLLLVAACALAQTALTNAEIIKMVKAGLNEDVIVSMVNSQPANYTLATDQLIELKTAGVPDRVVKAMVDKYNSTGISPVLGVLNGKATGATPSTGTVANGDPNDPMAPHDSGIYLLGNSNGKPTLTVLEQASYQGSKTGGVLGSAFTYGIKKVKTKAIIPGQHAGIHTSDECPTFYFYFEDKAAGLGKGGFFGGAGSISNPNQFSLIALEVKKNERETTIGAFGITGANSGTDQKAMVTFKAERVRPGLYKVTPDAPMPAGEYCFLTSHSMGAYGAGAAGMTTQIFDFAVTK